MKKVFLLVFFTFLYFYFYSQNHTHRYIKVLYKYVIDQVESESKLNELRADLLQIKGVEEVKFEYKPEKQRARAIIYTTQKVRQSEGDDEFKITALKQAIIKHNMLPSELIEEVVE